MREREYSICQAEVPANASRAAAHPAHELIPVNLVACLLAGGVPAQDAAWTSDAAFLHITAYCLEASVAEQQGEDVRGEVVDRAEIEERLKMLPVEQFPAGSRPRGS